MNEFLNNAWDFVKRFWYILILVIGLAFVTFVLFVKPIAAKRKIVYRTRKTTRASGKSRSLSKSGKKSTKSKTKGAKRGLKLGNRTYPNTVQGRKDWSAAMQRRRKRKAA